MDVSGLDQNSLLTWCDDLHQVKSNVSQVQATLNLILLKTPTASDYRQLLAMLETVPESTVAERARQLLATPQVKVGVRLKQLYDEGVLPLLVALARINFKAAKTDKYVGYLLDYTPDEMLVVLGDEAGGGKAQEPALELKPDLESYPPVLPPIANDSLLIRVLTDKSYRHPLDLLGLVNFSRAHNAKLAVKGSAAVELAVLDHLDDTFPHLDEHELYVMAHRAMAPEILAKFALGYNLIDNYKYHLSKDISWAQKIRLFANVFLAYVAGLAEDGYSAVEIKTWLRRLYQPVLTDLGVLAPPQPVAVVAMKQLELLFKQVTSLYNVQPDKLAVEFVQLELDPFVAQLQINGKSYTLGTSSTSFDDAKEKAAAALFADQNKVKSMMETLINGYSSTIKAQPDPHQAAPASVQMAANMYQDHGGAGSKPAGPAALAPTPQPYSAFPPQPYGLLPDPSFRSGLDNNAKNTLYALLGQKRMAPVYKYHRAGNEFQASVLANETVLGVGYDINKRLASQKAAMNALSNETLLASLGLNGSEQDQTST
ncbi:uncharacterized protein CANTADRAFT_8496 [Suhomyces tanzawaensis NRRL Y-17324]|uniref:RNase III domain-containing protein n=1 Tax=Suhomyces tanzawaensis NRRL Y-17324 TaxID=984487 RepID=A0A1E4SBP6_9ASCO|nr:uncharacterized protein CANTADRAFT_8496 [Suhomyces tanzawaensis NRRL Y-17324]ODV76921.1 hypothetical protein CANTADRAFT_8496 [Suhomyces tanzawaensis NRRL Y-17324]